MPDSGAGVGEAETEAESRDRESEQETRGERGETPIIIIIMEDKKYNGHGSCDRLD